MSCAAGEGDAGSSRAAHPGEDARWSDERAPDAEPGCDIEDPDDACCPACGAVLERRGCWEPYGEGYVRRTWFDCPRCDPAY